MGWKASCIFISEREPGYIGTCPGHDSARAKDIVRDLGLGRHKSVGLSTFEQGINPETLMIGAYDGAAVIGLPDVSPYFEPDSRKTKRLLMGFPRASILAVSLHSVVNLWGYAYYEKGKCIRVRAGSADDGVFAEEGDPLPEEEQLFAGAEFRDGKRVYIEEFDGQQEEITEDAYGEEFVFELSQRFLGERIDSFDAEGLQVEVFRKSWF